MEERERPPPAFRRAKRLLRAGKPVAAAKALDGLARSDAGSYASQIVRLHRNVAKEIGIGHPRRALALLGRAAELDPDAPEVRFDVQRILLRTRLPAPLSCFAPGLSEGDIAPRALIAAMPRSASTYLSNLVSASTGWPRAALRFSLEDNDQDIDLASLRRFATRSTVTQQHCRATEVNLYLLQAFKVRPIVLVRDIADALLSSAEFRDRDAWADVDASHRLDVVIDQLGPWYLSFYAGWVRADRDSRLPLLWVGWDEVSADPVDTLRKIHDFLRLPSDADELSDAVRAVDERPERNRLVKGVAGRGRQAFSRKQLKRLAAMARGYPDVDFAPVGLRA